MSTHIPGLADDINRAASVISNAIQPLLDTVFGYEIRRSEFVPRGTTRRLPRRDDGRGIIAMHPLDAIAAETKGDPFAQSDEVAAYLSERVSAELDLSREAEADRVAAYEANQERRMRAWQATRPGASGE